MSIPHPQYTNPATEGRGFFVPFWRDWFQRMYQAIGLVNTLYTEIIAHTFTAISAGATQTMNVTVKGAGINDDVTLGLQGSLDAGLVYQTHVSADNTVTVTCNNTTAGSITPAAGNIRITVRSF